MSPPILQARNVYKTYRLGKVDVPVLRGVDVVIERGTFTAILGASGSGKSTLLHLFGGLDRPDPAKPAALKPTASNPNSTSGASSTQISPSDLLFEGRDINTFSAAEADTYRRQSVGFVFQFYHLLPELSVVENVTIAAMIRHGRFGYPTAEVTARATELLENFGLSHRLRHKPAELSGGERQRVAIARALINKPPVLLADEPTGNLDRVTGGGILSQLENYRKNTDLTLIMVTHDQELASRADRMIRLVDGKVA